MSRVARYTISLFCFFKIFGVSISIETMCVFVRFGIRVYVFFILKLFMGLNKAKSGALANPHRPASVPCSVRRSASASAGVFRVIYWIFVHLYDK